MRVPHHPRIKAMEKGWLVECPECRHDAPRGGPLPIGIGMLLESKLTAGRVRKNHAAGRTPAVPSNRRGGRGSSPRGLNHRPVNPGQGPPGRCIWPNPRLWLREPRWSRTMGTVGASRDTP